MSKKASSGNESSTSKPSVKDKKSRAPMSIKKVSLDHARKQIKTILKRQIDKLMEQSYKNLLDKDALANLALCHKLLSEFTKLEDEELSTLTDEELEALATKK